MMKRSRPTIKHTAKYRLVLPFRTTLCFLDGACVVLCAFTGLAQADAAKPLQLDTITVVDREPPYIAVDNNDTATVYKVGSEGVSLFGSSGNSNPYMVINRLPSVYAPSVDAYGLVNIPGGIKGLRVRGELSSHGGGGTVDGLPLTGINPGPGNQWLFDMENMAGVTLRQGPVLPTVLPFLLPAALSTTRFYGLKRNEAYMSDRVMAHTISCALLRASIAANWRTVRRSSSPVPLPTPTSGAAMARRPMAAPT